MQKKSIKDELRAFRAHAYHSWRLMYTHTRCSIVQICRCTPFSSPAEAPSFLQRKSFSPSLMIVCCLLQSIRHAANYSRGLDFWYSHIHKQLFQWRASGCKLSKSFYFVLSHISYQYYLLLLSILCGLLVVSIFFAIEEGPGLSSFRRVSVMLVVFDVAVWKKVLIKYF